MDFRTNRNLAHHDVLGGENVVDERAVENPRVSQVGATEDRPPHLNLPRRKAKQPITSVEATRAEHKRHASDTEPIARSEGFVKTTLNALAAKPTIASVFYDLVNGTRSKARVAPADAAWIQSLLQNMLDGCYILQRPLEYLEGLGYDTSGIDTRRTGLTGDTATEAVKLKSFARKAGIRIAVLGATERRPKPDRLPLKLDAAQYIVLPRGDAHAAHQFIYFLDYVASGRMGRRNELRRKTLIVQDVEFYLPLFERLFGSVPRDEDPKAFVEGSLKRLLTTLNPGEEIAEDRIDVRVMSGDQSVEDFSAREPSKSTAPAQPSEVVALVDDNAMARKERRISRLFIVSTKGDKFFHWEDALEGRTSLRTLVELFDALGDIPERRRTNGGNADAKAEWVVRLLRTVLKDEHHSVSRAALHEKLREFGIDPDNGDQLIAFTDDRGEYFKEWKKFAPYFRADLLQRIEEVVRQEAGGQNPDIQDVPGVELTWFLNVAGGVQALHNEVALAMDRYETATGDVLERTVTSTCWVTWFRFNANTGAVEYRRYAGSTPFLFRAPKDASRAHDTRGWCVPRENNPMQLSVLELAQADGARGEYNPWVKVLRAMEADGHVFAQPDVLQTVSDYRIHVAGSETTADSLRAGMQNRIMQTLARRTQGDLQAEIRGARREQAEETAESVFDPYRIEAIDRHDAVVFDRIAFSDSSVAPQAKLLYELSSALVDRELHPERKSLAILLNVADPGLQIAWRLLQSLHAYGLADEPAELVARYTGDEQALSLMESHWRTYERIGSSSGDLRPSRADLIDVRSRLNRSRAHNKSSLVVLGSAKTQESQFVDETRAVIRAMVPREIDLVYGAGAKGVMGISYTEYLRQTQRLGTSGRVAGITTDIVVGKETADGTLTDELDVGHQTGSIVTRMIELFSADAAVFLAGGFGTFQELGFFCALKAYGDLLVKDKLGIIVNSLTPDGCRLYDDFLEFCGYQTGEDISVGAEARKTRGVKRLSSIGVRVVYPDVGANNLEAEIGELLDQARAERREAVTENG